MALKYASFDITALCLFCNGLTILIYTFDSLKCLGVLDGLKVLDNLEVLNSFKVFDVSD